MLFKQNYPSFVTKLTRPCVPMWHEQVEQNIEAKNSVHTLNNIKEMNHIHLSTATEITRKASALVAAWKRLECWDAYYKSGRTKICEVCN